ncbi:hypothetical protein [Helicobacter salomonis]|uniref:hypothetical protein n=1 Tax=Helicobacter salomonis TaxID=56878 RepID=UPI000CF1B436|nr:hypothetical protein [Helicobacter salomonis]
MPLPLIAVGLGCLLVGGLVVLGAREFLSYIQKQRVAKEKQLQQKLSAQIRGMHRTKDYVEVDVGLRSKRGRVVHTLQCKVDKKDAKQLHLGQVL